MKLSEIARRTIWAIVILALIIMAASFIYYRSYEFLPFALGVALGAGLNVIKVFILERNIDKSLTMEKKAATNYLRLQYLLRFVMTGVVLYLAVALPFVNLWGAAAGIITLHIAIFITKRIPEKSQEASKSESTMDGGRGL